MNGLTGLKFNRLTAIGYTGTHTLNNLVPVCAFCNLSKSNKLPFVEWFLMPNMMSMRFIADTSGVDYLLKHADEMADAGAYEAVTGIYDYIRANWSSESPSSPGNPPAMVTGYLDQSIKVEKRDALGRFASAGKAISWVIRVEAEYALALEFGNDATNLKARPFFHPAVKAIENQLGIHITTAFRVGAQRASALSKASFLARGRG